MLHRFRTLLLALAATGMALSALPHALGAWPHFRGALEAAGVDARAIGAVGAAWAFGTVMMVACGAAVAAQARRASRREALARSTLWPIGLAWLGYGVVAFALRDLNTHYLAFIACGAATLFALVLPVRR
jgi:ABC-type transport system involved in cytochrome c biogenesis permease component